VSLCRLKLDGDPECATNVCSEGSYAFYPGWSFQKKGVNVRKDGNITIYGIPYSEHSSYDELRDCVRTLRPRKLVPTVNAADPISAKALVDRYAQVRPSLLLICHAIDAVFGGMWCMLHLGLAAAG